MTITQKNKLVRDNVPSSITEQGRTPKLRILSKPEYEKEIFNKLIDEAKEVIEAKEDPNHLNEEIADVFEVLDTIIKIKNLNLDQIKKIQTDKRNKWGGFDQQIWLESVIEKE